MNFLALNTRPDIAYAVHQCAKYSSCPKQSHGGAIKRIGRYLRKTSTKGLILRPDGSHQLNAYVDADFAGNWNHNYSHLRSSQLSRAGCVITYSGCPIHWFSKLETEIALSTCEAEYIALSMCCRQLIPIRRTLEDLYSIFKIPFDSTHTELINQLGSSVVLEDNSAALALATDGDKYRPQTKHLSLKWHHFRDQITDGWLQIKKINTKVNWADIFTKPLPKPHFEFLRDAMMGWKTSEELHEYLHTQHLDEDLPLYPSHAVAAYAILPTNSKQRYNKRKRARTHKRTKSKRA